MKTNLSIKELYDTDENVWFFENAKLIRENKFSDVDWENIAEELELMGKRDFREVHSRLVELIMHLLKWIYQPGYRGSSWEISIRKQRLELSNLFADSKNLYNKAVSSFDKAYQDACYLAISETGLLVKTFPQEPPFSFEQVVDKGYWPR